MKKTRSCPPCALIFPPRQLSIDRLGEKHSGCWRQFFKTGICRGTCASYVQFAFTGPVVHFVVHSATTMPNHVTVPLSTRSNVTVAQPGRKMDYTRLRAQPKDRLPALAP